MTKSIALLFFTAAFYSPGTLQAQERTFQMVQVMDLPREFNPQGSPSCRLEFQEEWIIDPANQAITKTVSAFDIACDDSRLSVTLPDGTMHLKNISYEFSFLELPEQMAKEIQMAIISLVNKRYPLPAYYDPGDQLLSVYFHENWSIQTGAKIFTKKVRGLTPVIWQRRQTADGEPLLDPDTGYPVFYKLELDRIELRNP